MHDLQKAVLAGQPSLTVLLRRTMLIASNLNLQTVLPWVDQELTGFAEDIDPPNYRKVFTRRLEVYNAHRDAWQFAGNLNYALKAREPMADIEAYSRRDCIDFPVAKNFSIKNDFGDSFGSDWPQRFVVLGSEYQQIVKAVVERWTAEFEKRGLRVIDLARFSAFLEELKIPA